MWPALVLGCCALGEVVVDCEGDVGEEGEEVGCGGVLGWNERSRRSSLSMNDGCYRGKGGDVRLPMRPDFISQVISTPYGARMSSGRRVNWMGGQRWDGEVG